MDYKYWSTRTDEELEAVDVGKLNLFAAQGLRGSERIDVEAYCRRLDDWAEQVRRYTEELLPQFLARPHANGGTNGRFLMMALVTVLQRDLGVQYDPSCMTGDINHMDSRPWFIHGLLEGSGGTCVSMPMLYLAIGRRLGYPLYLCRAHQHLFLRWDEPNGERFNIECTCRGFRAEDDDHFRRHPKPLPEVLERTGFFLRNLMPREYLAALFSQRGMTLLDNLRLDGALEAAEYAYECAPKDQHYVQRRYVTYFMQRPLQQLLPQAVRGELPTSMTWVPPPNAEEWRIQVIGHAKNEINRILRLHRPFQLQIRDRLAQTVEFSGEVSHV